DLLTGASFREPRHQPHGFDARKVVAVDVAAARRISPSGHGPASLALNDINDEGGECQQPKGYPNEQPRPRLPLPAQPNEEAESPEAGRKPTSLQFKRGGHIVHARRPPSR